MWIDDSLFTVYYFLRMRTAGTKTALGVLIAGALSLPGCGGPNTATTPAQMICPDGVTRADVVQAADDVLTGMHFAIEKLDAEEGLVRTKPLRGGQFFELWRSDNAGAYNWEEANLQSVRRSVELRVTGEAVDRRPEGDPKRDQSRLGRAPTGETGPVGTRTQAGDTYSLQPIASRLRVECEVSVQRLSLPPNEVTGTSEAYRIHSASMPTLQRIEVTPQQRRAMAWIDLGQDPDLAARILTRVEQRLERLN